MFLSLQVSCHTASRLLTKWSSFLQGEGTDRLGIPQSAIVRRYRFFWLFSSTRGRFFRCCLVHLTDFSLFRKGHVLYFTEKQKRSSFPNHHWTETQQISREKKASRVSNLRCGWSCQAISVTSVTLYSPSLEWICCMESRQLFSRASHSRITLTALPAFRKRLMLTALPAFRKQLFCSLDRKHQSYPVEYYLESVEEYSEGIHNSEPEPGNGNVNTVYFDYQARWNTRISRRSGVCLRWMSTRLQMFT